VAEPDYGNFREPRTGRGAAAAVRSFTDKAAGKVKQTTAYFRNREMTDVVADVRKFLVAHPGPALAGAVVLGFVAGRLLRRD
jgi:hypothetical protein